MSAIPQANQITRDEALRLQRENCKDSMNFLSYSGYCWSCTYDLVQHYGLEAIASGMNVTGCPICHKSYCD